MSIVRGLAYPLRLKGGKLDTEMDFRAIEDQIVSVLETRPGERVMRADYGFDPKIFDTLEPNAINSRIWFAITTQVPDVSDVEVVGNVSQGDNGQYSIKVLYKVQGMPAPPLELSLSM